MISRLTHALRRFASHPGGATAVEYGLILAGLSIVVVVALTATGTSLYGIMNTLSGRIAAAH